MSKRFGLFKPCSCCQLTGRRLLKHRLPIGLILLALSSNVSCDSGSESAVKVAFIYNFFKFIQWPNNANIQEGYTLCILNAAELGGAVSALNGKTPNDKPLTLLTEVSVSQMKTCNVLFVADNGHNSPDFSALQNLPVVTVGDGADFAARGGMIGLIKTDNHLGFEINLDAANQANIKISAQLLKLAKHIYPTK